MTQVKYVYIGGCERVSPCNSLGHGKMYDPCNDGTCPGRINEGCAFKHVDPFAKEYAIRDDYKKYFTVLNVERDDD